MNCINIWNRLLIAFGLKLWTSVAVAQTITVYGWPLPDVNALDSFNKLGDDPIVGRLACPPLSRTNLRSQKVDHLLLRRVTIAGSDWHFELRTGLTWWGGGAVTPSDLAQFLETSVASIARARGAGLWQVPALVVKTNHFGQVTVTWQEKPSFGPYILNGIPFTRPVTSNSPGHFECVGLHRLLIDRESMWLQPRMTQRSRVAALNLRPATEKIKSDNFTPYLAFKTAPDFSGNPWTRPGDDPASCNQTVDLPLVTMIAWRAQSGPTADPGFRRLMTQLVPRGPLLRAGAAGLGELLTAPIPKRHPGYDANLPLRPSDLEAASQGLDKLGYRRSGTSGLRKIPQSNDDLKLVIATVADVSTLVEKVLVDSFQAVGISTRFVRISELREGESFDGLLGIFKLDWPESDLLTDFHSGSNRSGENSLFLGLHHDSQLDQALERYSLSLSYGEPKFSLLTAVHRRLYELELVTVVMQHKACLQSTGVISLTKGAADVLDPDWFRTFVFSR